MRVNSILDFAKILYQYILFLRQYVYFSKLQNNKNLCTEKYTFDLKRNLVGPYLAGASMLPY